MKSQILFKEIGIEQVKKIFEKNGEVYFLDWDTSDIKKIYPNSKITGTLSTLLKMKFFVKVEEKIEYEKI